jgi:ABC-type branched-subunit amino acid transport system ATPase component
VLELQGLTRRYGDLVVLDDLSFTVREGQMFGFIGPTAPARPPPCGSCVDAKRTRRGQPKNAYARNV